MIESELAREFGIGHLVCRDGQAPLVGRGSAAGDPRVIGMWRFDAEFTVYRHEFYVVRNNVYRRLKRLRRGSGSFESYRVAARRSLGLLVNYRSRIGRLAPPLYPRAKHRKLVRRTQRAVTPPGGCRQSSIVALPRPRAPRRQPCCVASSARPTRPTPRSESCAGSSATRRVARTPSCRSRPARRSARRLRAYANRCKRVARRGRRLGIG